VRIIACMHTPYQQFNGCDVPHSNAICCCDKLDAGYLIYILLLIAMEWRQTINVLYNVGIKKCNGIYMYKNADRNNAIKTTTMAKISQRHSGGTVP
jgi:hypothetical protein